MKALVLTSWGRLDCEDVPDPVLGAEQALLEVIAVGICGTDLHGYTGENGRRNIGQVMGHEFVGRVLALGTAVAREHGDLVGRTVAVNPVVACGRCAKCAAGRDQACASKYVLGVAAEHRAAFAEQISVPVRNLVPLPADLPAELGALVEPLAVGRHAVGRLGDVQGLDVVVIGGGPIGQACLLAASSAGAKRVIVSEQNPLRWPLLRSLGATVVDPRPPGDVLTRVTEALDGLADVTVDAVGSSATLADALGCTAPGGKVVLVGMAAPDVRLPAFEVSTAERDVLGSFCYSPNDFRATAEWISQNPSITGGLVGDRVDLDGADRAFAELAGGHTTVTKILVFPHGLT